MSVNSSPRKDKIPGLACNLIYIQNNQSSDCCQSVLGYFCSPGMKRSFELEALYHHGQGGRYSVLSNARNSLECIETRQGQKYDSSRLAWSALSIPGGRRGQNGLTNLLLTAVINCKSKSRAAGSDQVIGHPSHVFSRRCDGGGMWSE